MEKGMNALLGAFERAEDRPPVDFSTSECKDWDDQWGNWDDWGGKDPGWGDVGN